MNWENLRHNTNAKARLCTWVLTSSCDLSLSSGSDFSKQAKSRYLLPNQVPLKVEFLVWSERRTIGISLFPVTLRQWRRCQTKLPDFYKLSTFFHCICFSPRYKRQEYLFSFFSKSNFFLIISPPSSLHVSHWKVFLPHVFVHPVFTMTSMHFPKLRHCPTQNLQLVKLETPKFIEGTPAPCHCSKWGHKFSIPTQ